MRILTEQLFDDAKRYVVIYGLSTDTKPTGYVMGSVFVEVDTGKAFLYNETADAWVEQ